MDSVSKATLETIGGRWVVGAATAWATILGMPHPLQAQCFSDADCDDSNPCTDDSCFCDPGPCPGLCINASLCEDEFFCDGVELCCTDPLGCSGTPFGQCVDGTPFECEPGQFCDEDLNACVECTIDADCDDGEFCNGAEFCVSNACTSGPDACLPGQTCDEGTDECLGQGIPTVSQWGMLAMALLVLTAGTLVLMRRGSILTRG
jgi:hypothetical protein